MVRYAEPGTVKWVGPGDDPLMPVPETVLPFRAGADGEETASGHDRAREADGPAGPLPVGDSTALVLGDGPAANAFLPEHATLVRRVTADPEAELPASVTEALRTAPRQSEAHRRGPGPLLLFDLFDAARPGPCSADTEHIDSCSPRAATRSAARVRPGPETWLDLVQPRHPG